MNRLTRQEAAKFLCCSINKLYHIEKAGLMADTYYDIGAGQRNKRLYITERLEFWALQGREPAAWERKLQGVTLMEAIASNPPYMPVGQKIPS